MYVDSNTRCGSVHRIAFELANGAIPDGMVLDHRCRTPICTNADHLEVVTRRVNTLRGIGPSAVNATKKCCGQGHPLSGENLYVAPGGKRVCKACRRATKARYLTRRVR
ncbi:MAG: HNH endonuclease signature motif containing protein [Xanthobacteraceae bacterium]